MSNLKNQMKSTGDTHLSEVESNQHVEGGSPIGQGTRGMQTTRVGNAVKKAGVITDQKPQSDDDTGATQTQQKADK